MIYFLFVNHPSARVSKTTVDRNSLVFLYVSLAPYAYAYDTLIQRTWLALALVALFLTAPASLVSSAQAANGAVF
jgi:hypothetical protein